MASSLRTKPSEVNDLGVFRSNRERPIHRWYPFVEGYSAELVDRALKNSVSEDGAIFDPFGGSGTTSLAAALSGRESFYTEVNPYLAWVAHVKVNSSSAAFGHPSLAQLLSFRGVVASHHRFEAPEEHPLCLVDAKRKFFPDGVAVEIAGMLSWIEREVDSPAGDLARLAVATSLIPCSNMVRRTDLRRRYASDAPPQPLRPTVAGRLDMILEDVQRAGWMIGGAAIQVGTDVRELGQLDKALGLIVTSPPYLNGTNYFRNTKLELLALGLIHAEAELAQWRSKSITAGINNVSSRRIAPERIPCVEPFARRIDEVAYDQRIPALVRGYFSDMRLALERIRANALSTARFFLDIGDSRFAGVHVPTDELLVKVAQEVGWRLVTVTHLRNRRSYDGSPLRQVLIEFGAA